MSARIRAYAGRHVERLRKMKGFTRVPAPLLLNLCLQHFLRGIDRPEGYEARDLGIYPSCLRALEELVGLVQLDLVNDVQLQEAGCMLEDGWRQLS